jgi:hypothetical protein
VPTIGPGGDIHKRFFLLTGLVRHEFWLHHQNPDDYGFVADPESFTLTARRQHDHDHPCILQVTPALLEGDLDALAREFFAEHCKGSGILDRRHQRRA